VVFSSDGRTLASGSYDNTVRLWNVATWREVIRLDPGVAFVPRSLAFSPDDTQLLAAAYPAILWSTRPDDGGQPDQTARRLAALLESKADFTSRIRMISEGPPLDEALEILRRQKPDDTRVQAALAATRANQHASRQQWKQAAEAIDQLTTIPPHQPEAWFRTPGLLRLATALLHENRPADAAELLTGGAKRRTEDGLPPAGRMSPELLVASSAIIPPSSSSILSVFAGLTREGFVNDPATEEQLYPLRAAVKERLAKEPRNAGLLELRAELAGQWSDWKAQAADYTAAIEILAEQPAGAASSHLQRLYRRRGDAYVAMQKWPEAVDDYAHVITQETTDALLLSNRARAHEGLKKWDAAAADWARAVTGHQEGAKWLAEFARRLAADGQVSLAKAQFEKSQALYERLLEADPESSPVAPELAQLLLDKQQHENAALWTDLKPVEAKSELGAILSILPDDSILASGANPLNDRYRVVLTLPKDIDLAAVRLEALPHPSLPGNGPGRHQGGHFAQTSWNVTAASRDRKDPITLQFDNAWADHDHREYPITAQGNWNTGGVGEGRNCAAVWSMSKPVSLAADTMLTFQMQFKEWNGVGENLGHFRLSVSGDAAALDRTKKRLAPMKLTDPWVKLAAAYHVLGDQQALGKLLKHHSVAAAGIGDVYAAVKDWERAIAEYGKVITDQPADANLLTKLYTAYQSAGRTREGVPHLAAACAANPNEAILSLNALKVAALQAWFGQEKEFADSGRRALELTKSTTVPEIADRVVKACCLRSSTDKAQQEAAVALARKAVQLGKDSQNLPWFQICLGMAEYRSGHFAEADAALLDAAQRGKDNPHIAGTSAFYRAMCLLRQGTEAGARKLAITAAAKMKPLPKDEKNPLANNANHDDLILWLAYKEAMTLLKIKLSPIELLEEARNDEVKTLGADHPTTLATTNKLADAYLTSSRTREAVPLLATVSAATPSDTSLSLKVAALQAWFGQDKEFAATRQRILGFAKGTNDTGTADHAAKACSIRASTDKAELEAALALGRTAVKIDKNGMWNLLALGMAEYRNGNDAAAVEALLAAAKAGPNNSIATGIAAFYRAMSLFRQGKHDEARKLAIESAAQMKPLPKDEQNPFANGAYYDDLILWLAYKEAKAMIKFDAAAPPTG
jgi:tetratricopeptide (TPR) repeat protein